MPRRREWQPSPVFLPGEFHGQTVGSQRVGQDWASNTFTFYSNQTAREKPASHTHSHVSSGDQGSGIPPQPSAGGSGLSLHPTQHPQPKQGSTWLDLIRIPHSLSSGVSRAQQASELTPTHRGKQMMSVCVLIFLGRYVSIPSTYMEALWTITPSPWLGGHPKGPLPKRRLNIIISKMLWI